MSITKKLVRLRLNQTTRDLYTRVVTLSEAKGLAVRFFAGAQNDKAGRSHRRVCQCPVVRFRWINKCTITHAENYLFASEANEGIKKIFDRTKPPERFQVSHPFSKNEE